MEGKQTREVAFPLEKNIWSIFQISHKKNLVFYPSCKQMLYILPNPIRNSLAVGYSTFCLTSCSESSKESACNAGDTDSIPELGISLGEGNGNPLQYSCQGNPMDRGAQWAPVQRVGVGHSLAAKPLSPPFALMMVVADQPEDNQ